MDADSFVLSFDTNQEGSIEFLKQNKNELDFSELIKNHQLYNPTNKKGLGKMKIETSPVLVLDSFTALRSKSYSFSYHDTKGAMRMSNGTEGALRVVQKAKQKGIQKAPKRKEYQNSLFNSETSSSTNISIRSIIYTTSQLKNNLSCL